MKCFLNGGLHLEDAAFLHSIRLSEQVEVGASDFNVLHAADERASDNLPPANIQQREAFRDTKEACNQSRQRLVSPDWSRGW